MTCWPSVDTRPGTQSHAQVIDRRLAVPREPRFFTAAEWATARCGLSSGSCRSRRIVRRCRWRPMLDAKMCRSGDGFRDARHAAAWRSVAPRSGGASRQKAQRGTAAALSTALTPAEQDALLRHDATRRTVRPGVGRHAVQNCSSITASCPTSSMPITPSRPPGTKSALAARPVRAATCAWSWTGAIPGRRPRPTPGERGARTAERTSHVG